MNAFAAAFAEADDWAHIGKHLSDQLRSAGAVTGIGVLYVNDVLAGDFRSIVTYLSRTTGVETWVGTLGFGVLGGNQAAFDRPAAAAMILDLPSDSFRVMPNSPIPGRLADDVVTWAETVRPSVALVHGDGSAPGIAALIETLAARAGAYLLGGLTGSRTAQHQVAGEIGSGGLSGLLLAPTLAVTVGLTQGCTPLGGVHTVTAGEDNVIFSLDERPALEVLKDDIGEILARDLQRLAGYVHVAFPVRGSDTGDYLVRSLIAVDRENGWLGVGTEIAPGDRVMFVRRDPASADADLQRMLTDVRRRMPGPARGAIYIPCVARGPNMFGSESGEAERVAAALAPTPVIGFYAAGEISNDRLYGYTGVLLVFG